MAQGPQPRRFEVNPANAKTPPLLLGFMGPPGGGKTKSALRVAEGICSVRGGKPFVIDTEAGRSLRYHVSKGGPHDFDFVQFTPPFIPAHFMDAIKQGVAAGAGCIIVDSMSDEHEGEGGVLDWHDQEVPKMGGNEWAAWSKPKASRRVLISGIQQVAVPVILTFRAREKTVTKEVMKNGRTRNEPVNVGYQPVAPLEIVHTLDLTCLLPPRADGVPMWESPKEGEDFVIKLPEFLAPFIRKGAPLDEELGVALAKWQAGTAQGATQQRSSAPAQDQGRANPSETSGKGRADADAAADWVASYIERARQCRSIDALTELRDYENERLQRIRKGYPDLWRDIIAAETEVETLEDGG